MTFTNWDLIAAAACPYICFVVTLLVWQSFKNSGSAAPGLCDLPGGSDAFEQWWIYNQWWNTDDLQPDNAHGAAKALMRRAWESAVAETQRRDDALFQMLGAPIWPIALIGSILFTAMYLVAVLVFGFSL